MIEMEQEEPDEEEVDEEEGDDEVIHFPFTIENYRK